MGAASKPTALLQGFALAADIHAVGDALIGNGTLMEQLGIVPAEEGAAGIAGGLTPCHRARACLVDVWF